MLTNVPDSGPSALDRAGVLRTYKGQYGVENDFAFLKDPLVVNDLFLKTPARIDALGMILIIALMIYRLMERSMRLIMQQTNQTVPGWDNRPTDKPTTFMLAAVFLGIQVMLLKKTAILSEKPIREAFGVSCRARAGYFRLSRPWRSMYADNSSQIGFLGVRNVGYKI